MPHQVAVTVRAPVRPGARADLASLLDKMSEQGAARNEVLPFADLGGVHFARIFVLDEITDLAGEHIPACLYYMADVDAPLGRHLVELATVLGEGTDTLFGHCEDYPPGTPWMGERIKWLAEHLVRPAAIYVHTVGRSVDQVREEASLRDTLQELIDTPGVVPPDELDPVTVHRRIRSAALTRADSKWARQRARGTGLLFKAREAVRFLVVLAIGLALLPWLAMGALGLVVLVRLRELRDVPENARPTPDQAGALERREDFVAQNPFTAVGFVKPGVVRKVTMRVALFGLDFANRYAFKRDNLAGVRTIHFARWVPIDDGRRLIFASSYDGSLESYMDDFIDRLWWGLNLVFSNGVGFPSTRWLVLGGSRDEQAFKYYLRCHQVAAPVWYSAYDTLPARNVDANMRIRDGLRRDLDTAEADEWLALL